MPFPTPSLDDSEKIAKATKNYLLPIFKDLFLERQTIEKQFQEILLDLHSNKHSVIIADKIATAIQHKFQELQKKMSRQDYHAFCTSVIKSIQAHLDSTIAVWNDVVVNFKDVNEIWISCEPMLDLVKDNNGTFDLLLKQLNKVDKIVYFLSNPNYFNDLANLISQHGEKSWLCKLELVTIDSPLISPIVIYFSETPHGVIGKYHPEIRKSMDGFYVFDKKLCNDWMRPMDDVLFINHLTELRKLKKKV